jgi:hypothetical protein
MKIKFSNNEVVWSSGKTSVVYSTKHYVVTFPCTFGHVTASRKLDWGVWSLDDESNVEWIGEFADKMNAVEYVLHKEHMLDK